MGWGIAVAVAVFVSGKLSPAYLNPAVTIGVALKGGLPWASVLPYILAQFAGAMLGAALAVLVFSLF
ncbi:glycerol uptake facilitator protein [Streptococcus pneumoniae]|nr:glycerol uptake facilitator protein [Streptococcus pneumoniae]